MLSNLIEPGSIGGILAVGLVGYFILHCKKANKQIAAFPLILISVSGVAIPQAAWFFVLCLIIEKERFGVFWDFKLHMIVGALTTAVLLGREVLKLFTDQPPQSQ